MSEGSIKKIVSDRGFGFILPEGGGEDVFFHVSALEGLKIEALGEGDQVEYETEIGDKGSKATVVRKKCRISAVTGYMQHESAPIGWCTFILPSTVTRKKRQNRERRPEK